MRFSGTLCPVLSNGPRRTKGITLLLRESRRQVGVDARTEGSERGYLFVGDNLPDMTNMPNPFTSFAQNP
jgi:hypothetical protein